MDINIYVKFSTYNSSSHVADNVGERNYLQTEGDPGAAGYTIKEAVALTRSVVCYLMYLSIGMDLHF